MTMVTRGRRVRSIVVALALVAAGVPSLRAQVTEANVVEQLDRPTAVAFLPDGRLVVTEQAGGVALVTNGVAASLGTIAVCSGQEMGLLGVAVDPEFASTGYLYFYRTEADGGCAAGSGRVNEVIRATLTGETLGAIMPLLTGIRTDLGRHNGGGLRIGPDEHLWVSIGDAATGDSGEPGMSTNPYAQDLGDLAGKLVRITRTGGIPADNPFVGQAGVRAEIWAYGFRNPFRFGFDPLTGIPWVGDVGQRTVEEIDRVLAGSNHGWPACEGTLPAGCPLSGQAGPAYTYPHDGSERAVAGGAFVASGPLAGTYFFADYVLGRIYHATLNPDRTGFAATPVVVSTTADGPVDLVMGPDGALYYVAIAGNAVRRLTMPGLGDGTTTTTTLGGTTSTGDTTTTTAASVTTTTTLPSSSDCDAELTVACIGRALDDVRDRLAPIEPAGLGRRLRRPVDRARGLLDRPGDVARRRAALRAAVARMDRFLRELTTRGARVHLGPAAVEALVADARAIRAWLRALRVALRA